MCSFQNGVALIFLMLGTFCEAHGQDQMVTLGGSLTRVMAIGSESTGWAIELESNLTVGGKRVSSIEVDSSDRGTLQKLAGKRVEASGTLGVRRGVETGLRIVLNATSLREASAQAGAEGTPEILAGKEWVLEDLAGRGVLDRAQATLTIQGAGRVSGNASCNRFTGKAEIRGEMITLGPLVATRKACPEAVMNQETAYMKALQSAERWEIQADFLVIHCTGLDKPLRFSRKTSPNDERN